MLNFMSCEEFKTADTIKKQNYKYNSTPYMMAIITVHVSGRNEKWSQVVDMVKVLVDEGFRAMLSEPHADQLLFV